MSGNLLTIKLTSSGIWSVFSFTYLGFSILFYALLDFYNINLFDAPIEFNLILPLINLVYPIGIAICIINAAVYAPLAIMRHHTVIKKLIRFHLLFAFSTLYLSYVYILYFLSGSDLAIDVYKNIATTSLVVFSIAYIFIGVFRKKSKSYLKLAKILLALFTLVYLLCTFFFIATATP